MILHLNFSFLKMKDITKTIILKMIILCFKMTIFKEKIKISRKNDFNNFYNLFKSIYDETKNKKY